MNHYIDAQCKNMIATVNTFEYACQLAATKDDGIISKEEEKQLKKIMSAAKRFKDELSKI